MIRKTIPLILGCMLLLATVASCGKGDGASSGSDSITFSAKKRRRHIFIQAQQWRNLQSEREHRTLYSRHI